MHRTKGQKADLRGQLSWVSEQLGPTPTAETQRRESFLGETGSFIWKTTLLLHLLHVFLQSSFWAEMSGKQ